MPEKTFKELYLQQVDKAVEELLRHAPKEIETDLGIIFNKFKSTLNSIEDFENYIKLVITRSIEDYTKAYLQHQERGK